MVIAAPASPPLELPFLILLYAAIAVVLFFALARLAKGAVAYVVGGSLVLALLASDVFALAGARDAQRRSEAATEAELDAVLAEVGLLRATAVDRLNALPVALSADPMGEGRGDLVAIRSSTVGAPPIPGAVRFEHAPFEILFSGAFFEAERSADLGHLFQWGAAFALVALLAFVLGGLGQLSKGWRSFVKHRHAYYYMAPAMIGMAILVFIPVVYGIVLGFMDRRYNVWAFTGIANYIAILSDFDVTNPQNFYFKLGVTVLWTVTNVSLHVSIGLFLALLLNDQMLKARGLFRVILIIPWAIPNYITGLVWRGLFHRQFGAVNIVLDALGFEPIAWFQSFWPAFSTNLATNTWLGFPFMMVVSLGALQSIPGDLYEAAWVDGASRWQRFARITLPLLMPALVPAVIMGTVWTFNMFNIIYLVSGGAPNGATDILITDAFRWAFERDRYGYAAAYSTLIFLLLLTFTVATNRITGATKGAFE
ncbi:MAG: sugar ABC transporter permease [Deltaproteobacteria bacterium]|nr:sugar ABC transporter permease [Deltaproteobacteria bacterium]